MFNEDKSLAVVCNGEIYNWKSIAASIKMRHDTEFSTNCDCGVIAPLFDYYRGDISKMCRTMDGEFTFIIYDTETNRTYFATDELSTRPLFIGRGVGGIYLSSELIGLVCLCGKAMRIPAGSYGIIFDGKVTGPAKWYDFQFQIAGKCDYIASVDKLRSLIICNLTTKLHTGGREDGFFLSGGVDSSIVCAVATQLRGCPINTFTIGFSEDSPDIQAARVVATHIGSNHREYIISYADAVSYVADVIKCLGSYCQTTVRAATPMYMLLDRVRRDFPDIAIMYTGEFADEMFGGYKYMRRAPSPTSHRVESVRLLQNVHMYDGLRCDRVCSHFSIEPRYPFFSADILKFVLTHPAERFNPTNTCGIEKKMLRDAFSYVLPDDIINRPKDAFSDATSVKSEWKEHVIAYAESVIAPNAFKNRAEIYPYATPKTHEDMLYRNIFLSYYIGFDDTILGNWMPKWCGDDVTDSSASLLE